jgi:hypothetical protein
MAQINRDPDEVGSYLNRPVDAAAVAGFFGMILDHWRMYGFRPWALEGRERTRSRGDSSVSPAWRTCRRFSRPGTGA